MREAPAGPAGSGGAAATAGGVEWSGELEAAHRALSEVDLAFRRRAAGDDELLSRASFPTGHGAVEVVDHHVQPWPSLLGPAARGLMERTAEGICAVLRAAPERLLGNDPQRIADFFGLPDPRQVAVMLDEPTGVAEGLARGDFLWTEDGLKCLEINVSSAVGGWEAGPIAEALLGCRVIRRVLADLGVEPDFDDTLALTFRHAAEGALALGRGEGGAGRRRELNLALGYVGALEQYRRERMVGLVQGCWTRVLRQIDPALAGRAFFWGYDGAQLAADGLRTREGLPVDAVIEQHDQTHPLVFRAFKVGRLALYNGPSSLVLSDKRLLALLSAAADDGRLDGADGELVRRAVPWTRRLRPGAVAWPGGDARSGDWDAGELARAERGALVLKKGGSMGAKDVLLGDATEESAWEAAVERALAEGDWVLQRRVYSRPYLFQDGEHGCTECDVVWGPFVLGSHSGGLNLRIQPRSLRTAVTLGGRATAGVVFKLQS